MRHLAKWVVPLALFGAVAWANEPVNEARATIASFKQRDPGVDRLFNSAAAYVVFPTIKKGAFIVGGAGGDGVLFEGGVPTGTVNMTQVSVGAQVGGQTYSEVLFLADQAAIYRLKKNEVTLAAQASAVAADQGAWAKLKYDHGVSVYTLPLSGLMAEASVGGQKFEFHPFVQRPPS